VKYKILYFLLIIFYGCQSDSSIELRDDEIVTNHFSEDEISHLLSFLDYVDSEVQNLATLESTLAHQYQDFFRILKSQADTDPYGELSKFDVLRLKQIFAGISEQFFNEIWYIHLEDSNHKVGLNYSGKFAGFIETAAKSNPFIDNYFDALKNAGGMTPSMYASVLMEPERLNVNLGRERLFLAIHYITIVHENILNQLPVGPDR